MNPLDKYKNKVIRYWIVSGNEECLFGILISWDSIGILLGTTDKGFKGIDGSEFYPWEEIKMLGYFKDDN